MVETRDEIIVDHIKKDFYIEQKKVEVLKEVSLRIPKGDIISIVGGSGCGKSTLLRLIAGLESPSDGQITIQGEAVTKPSLKVGVLFQESRLLPWENVEKNIMFGLPEKVPGRERKQLAQKYIELVGLQGFEKALPGQLSGGMQKRVAIARTLINQPSILLLDEPFGALDAFTKINLQKEVLNIWKKLKMTTILVTHDIDEAIYMGNRVIVMSDKPGVIKREIPVELALPKQRTNEEFAKIRRTVYEEFFEKEQIVEDYVI